MSAPHTVDTVHDLLVEQGGRRYDDHAKRPGAPADTIDAFGRVLRACVR